MSTGAALVYTTSCVAGDAGEFRSVSIQWAAKLGLFVMVDPKQGMSFLLAAGLDGCDPYADFVDRPVSIVALTDDGSAGYGAARASTYLATAAAVSGLV